jgi:hypothetical protein
MFEKIKELVEQRISAIMEKWEPETDFSDGYDGGAGELVNELAELEHAEYLIKTVLPNSYQNAVVSNDYYMAECSVCGWYGSSKYVGGGGQIADTGGYDDIRCPVCNSYEIDFKDN